MNVRDIARIAHEANRAYCEAIGDTSQPEWNAAPDWQKLSAVDGVLSIMGGKVTTPEEAHANWMEHKLADGWRFGAVKDAEAKTHPCMVAYAELPEQQRGKDALFFAVVRALV